MNNTVQIMKIETRHGVKYRPAGFVNGEFVRAGQEFETSLGAYDWLRAKFPQMSDTADSLGYYHVKTNEEGF